MLLKSLIFNRIKRTNQSRYVATLIPSPLKALMLAFSISLGLVGCGGGGGSSEPTEPPPTLTTLSEKIDFYVDQNQSDNTPGISIIVRKDEQVVYQLDKGMANIPQGTGITADTGFRTGSISKVFTSFAIYQLAEQGLINLDDALVDHIPELHTALSAITIKHLITHQSGLLDYFNDFDNVTPYDRMTNQEFIELNKDQSQLEFAPGSQSDYSNTGYILLAEIIERVSGQSYPDYMKTYFFTPFAMSNSYVVTEDQYIGQTSHLAALNFAQYETVLGIYPYMYGASGIVSTSNDLTKFVDAVKSGQIVSLETLTEMTTTQSSLSELGDFGVGWFTGSGVHWHGTTHFNETDYWHAGGFDGYRTLIVVSPEKGYDYIVLTNGGDATGDQTWRILEIIKAHYE